MQKAGRYEREGQVELAIACYHKANALMPMSAVSVYTRDYYMRLPRYLRKLRRFDEARAEEAKIEAMFPNASKISAADKIFIKKNRLSAMQRTDLVEVSWASACCETCGKYSGRIFSLSGKNRKFPPFPSDFCENCGLTYYPFYEEIGIPVYSKKRGKALIAEMNKPFVDTRTPEDINAYKELLKKQQEDADRESSRGDYDWLWEFLPELCTKSFSGYMRMKKANTEKFQKIVEEAKKRGHCIK